MKNSKVKYKSEITPPLIT